MGWNEIRHSQIPDMPLEEWHAEFQVSYHSEYGIVSELEPCSTRPVSAAEFARYYPALRDPL